MTSTTTHTEVGGTKLLLDVQFSHIQLYVDHVEDLATYKNLEDELNQMQTVVPRENNNNNNNSNNNNNNSNNRKEEFFCTQNRDVVKQLLVGCGFRVTGTYYSDDNCTRSVLVTSCDPTGVQILVTSIAPPTTTNASPTSAATSSSEVVDVVVNNEPAVLSSSPTLSLSSSPAVSTTKERGAKNPIFDGDKVRRFFHAHNGKQGIAVLAFQVNHVQEIYKRYQQHHPTLIDCYYTIPANSNDREGEEEEGNRSNGGTMEQQQQQKQQQHEILEVFAYYRPLKEGDDNNSHRVADTGTILRFVQFASSTSGDIASSSSPSSPSCLRLGMTRCSAVFNNSSLAAYCDHWVSNVYNRTKFLDTLHDTLDFDIKVDFNAGVVAAGEAQIESTVVGNNQPPSSNRTIFHEHEESNHTTTSTEEDMRLRSVLRDQSQVYLPINNALSNVGHVHLFLQQLGQGIQHVASRVENLIDFVQRNHIWREQTGEGFTFLRIPRSYYGILIPKLLTDDAMIHNGEETTTPSVSIDCAQAIISCLERTNVLSPDGALDLAIDMNDLLAILDEGLPMDCPVRDEFLAKSHAVCGVILRSRYSNLYNLLGDRISEDTYMGLVRNQILVDVQGDDLLYQIFTTNILQRRPEDEAPFFEFIQRVCSKGSLRPGCGGFGIRNFLTLFLSIEVGKAMNEVAIGKATQDVERQMYAQSMVDCFTEQLNESNPILTQIAEAMTEEGRCQAKLSELSNKKEVDLGDEASIWKRKLEAATDTKKQANLRLLECSTKFNNRMKALRETRNRV